MAIVFWTNAASDNDWSNPGNWSSGSTPTIDDDVIINFGNISNSANPLCNTVRVYNDAVLSVSNLTVGTGSTVAEFHNSSSLSGTIANSDAVLFDYSINAGGTIEGSGFFNDFAENQGAVNGPECVITNGSFSNAQRFNRTIEFRTRLGMAKTIAIKAGLSSPDQVEIVPVDSLVAGTGYFPAIPVTQAVNAVAPQIVWSGVTGEPAYCTNGVWNGIVNGFTYQWYASESGEIVGATSFILPDTSSVAGQDIQCKVTATNNVGSTDAYSNSVLVPAGVPEVISAPTISGLIDGIVYAGYELNCSTGVWTNAPTSYQYQWYVDGSPLGGETAATYTPLQADVNLDIYCEVTAINVLGSSSPSDTDAYTIGYYTYNTALPSIDGTVEYGQTLTVTEGTWFGSPTIVRDYWVSSDGFQNQNIYIGTWDNLTTFFLNQDFLGYNIRLKESSNAYPYQEAYSNITPYYNTAFISTTGNDGSAVLNDPSHPFYSFNSACAQIYGSASSLGNYGCISLINGQGDLTNVSNPYLTDNINNGLKLMSYGNYLNSMGSVWFGNDAYADPKLILDNISVAEVYKDPNTGPFASGGTIKGLNGASTNLITISGVDGANGGSGSNASNVYGTNGAAGADGDSGHLDGYDGEPGGDADASGGGGGSGENGNSAYQIYLLGNFTVASINGVGGNAGNGGQGGNGADAYGGNGGNGGNAYDDGNGTPANGGMGGNGGNAYANGGDGGSGGNGGDGAIVYAESGVSISAYYLSGGTGGTGASGGVNGYISTAGSGGTGGSGANGGSNGSDGSGGTAYQNGGNSGFDGSPGANGYIQAI